MKKNNVFGLLQMCRKWASLSSSLRMMFVLTVVFSSIHQFTLALDDSEVSKLSFHTLRKVVRNIPTSVIIFDENYPADNLKDKEFKKLAHDLRLSDDIFVGHLVIPYQGAEEQNDDEKTSASQELALAKKLNGTKDLPHVFLYRKNDWDNPIPFNGEKFDALSLREFIRQKVPNLVLVLESCIPELDNLARKFSKKNSEKDLKVLITEAKSLIDSLKHDSKRFDIGNVYLKIMERIIERGSMFILSEKERVNNLLNGGKLSDSKKNSLNIRLNILDSFSTTPIIGDGYKQEL